MATLAPFPFWQFLDDDGTPLAGGKVYTYENNTTTNKTAYTDAEETTPAANPVILDAYGRAVIYLSGTYTLKITDASNNLIRTVDDVASGTNSSAITYASDTGSANSYVLTPTPPISAYAAGQYVDLKPANANTGASTLQVSGLTAKNIKLPDGNDPYANAMLTTGVYGLVYDGTNFVLTNPNIAGERELWVPASAMYPTDTNGAEFNRIELASNDVMLSTYDFNKDTDEKVQFEIAMPKSWNEGTVTFQPIWSHASGGSAFVVIFGCQATATSNDDAMDAAFGTAQTSTDTGGTADDRYVGPESSAITIAGTPAAGDGVIFQIYRDANAAGDTLDLDARLHGAIIRYIVDAPNDD